MNKQLKVYEAQLKQKIYYTPDYGETGALGRILEIYKEQKEVLVQLEDNDYGFEDHMRVPQNMLAVMQSILTIFLSQKIRYMER